MASSVEIANAALTLLGHAPILSFLDDSDAARAVNALYPIVRDDLQASHPWNFCVKGVDLPALAGAPTSTVYTAWYGLPANTLRVLEIEPPDYSWVVEGQAVLTNAPPPITARVITRIEDTTGFPPWFTMALIYRLAAELCNTLTARRGNKQDWQAIAEAKIREAKATDGLEGSPLVEDASPLGEARVWGSSWWPRGGWWGW